MKNMEKINTFLTPRNIVTLCLIAFFAIVFAQCAFGQNVDPGFGKPIDPPVFRILTDADLPTITCPLGKYGNMPVYDGVEIISLPYVQESVPEKTAYPWKSQLKKSIIHGSFALLSGAAGGLREGLHFRRTEFFRAFPKANRNYWDTNISSEVQPHFMGAARDGYHDAQYFHTGLLFASGASAGIIVAVPLIRKEKRPWWHVLTDIGIQGGASLAGYFLGSRIVYDVILHK